MPVPETTGTVKKGITMAGTYTLQLIHASDLEAANTALGRIPQFAAIIDKLDDQYANTLKLIAGDAWLPGPFYAAEGDASVTPALRTALTAAGVPGGATATAAASRVSVAVMDLVGTQVASFGNHEFDGGTGPINDALGVANFPYLSANYDFSKDTNLRTRVTADGQEASTIKGKIAGSTVVTIGGERIGIVGDTTQVLASISSPGLVTSKTPGTVDDIPALAKILQPYVDALTAQGINKIVLSSHLQQYQLEQQLIPLLRGVDIVVSAGSHALFADQTDVIRPGDVAAQTYPVLLRDADGNPVLQVNTENEYSYVGRLVADFDANGIIVPSSVNAVVSGNYATTDAVVQSLYGSADPYAAGSYGALARALIAPVGTTIATKDSNIQGYSAVFLNGDRVAVRQQESNLGDLSADANLFVARQVDPTTTVSIKNGGGIRDVIGSYTTDAAARPIPTQANPNANKPATAVSQLDIENSLRFNNNLSLVTVTAQQLRQVMEFGASLVLPGQTPGGFVQVGGLSVSYDTTRTAQVLDANGTPTTQGARVRNMVVLNDDGTIRDVIVQDGAIVGNAARPIRVVTLDFIATSTLGAGTVGGDSNPLAAYATNRVNLLNNPALPAGLSTFSAPGTEQDAMGEYLRARFPTLAQPYYTQDTAAADDRRIQILSSRTDTVLDAGRVAFRPLGSGYNSRASDFFNGVLGGGGFIVNAPDLASVGAPALGRTAAVQFSPAASGGTYILPTGFKAAALATSGTLFGQGSDYLLVGAASGGTLVAQTAGSATVVGGQAGTVMFGGSGATVLVGGDGDDTIVAGTGNNTIFTGRGANVVGLDGGDAVVVSEGRGDTVIGGAGSATVGATNGAVVFNRAQLTFIGGNERSTVVGGAGSVTLSGGAGGGVFSGGTAGRNVMTAGTGAATLIGGGDGDVLSAGGRAGTVMVAAASGNATLTAGGGIAPNTFFAGGGNTVMTGGAGNEVFFAGSGAATVTSGRGADVIAGRERPGRGHAHDHGLRPGGRRPRRVAGLRRRRGAAGAGGRAVHGGGLGRQPVGRDAHHLPGHRQPQRLRVRLTPAR